MILVTGAAGYIGSHFVRKFLTENSQSSLIGVDDLSAGHLEALPQSDRFTFYKANIADFDQLTEIMTKNKVQAVVHFAASCYVGESETDPFKYFQNNVINTIRLLEAMNACNVNRMVFSSSCATYGIPDQIPLTESNQQKPINVYGQTKLIVESLLETLHRTKSFSYIALRYFNAAGADESGEIGESHSPETHLIPNALKSANDPSFTLEIYGDNYETRDGTCIRDYVHVNDLATAHIAALRLVERDCLALGINLGTGHGASVREIADLCSEISGVSMAIKVLAKREGDPPILVADYSKASEILGWTPQYDLKKIIETAWNWEKSRRY